MTAPQADSLPLPSSLLGIKPLAAPPKEAIKPWNTRPALGETVIPASIRGRRLDPSNGMAYRWEDFFAFYSRVHDAKDVWTFFGQCQRAAPLETDIIQWIKDNHRYQKSPKHILKAIKEMWHVRQFRDLGFGGWGNWLDEVGLREEVMLSYAASRVSRLAQHVVEEKPPGMMLDPRLHAGAMPRFQPPMSKSLAQIDTFPSGLLQRYSQAADAHRTIESMPSHVAPNLDPSANDLAEVRIPQLLQPSPTLTVVAALRASLAQSPDFTPVSTSVLVFGSALNGFGSCDSDIDVVLKIVNAKGIDEGRHTANKWLKAVVAALEALSPSLFNVQEVNSEARIPILKVVYTPTMHDIDISINNMTPLANSYLLLTYASLDPRVQMLGVDVKQWAKDAGVCGASDGFLSSYDLVLMVIYFLQVTKFALPSLQAMLPDHDWFQGDAAQVSADMLHGRWRSDIPIEALRRGFFYFYAHDFYWGTEVVTVLRGQRCWQQDPTFADLTRVHVDLDIQDPFEHSRNLACHFQHTEKFEIFLAAIAKEADGRC